jgi:hypothetical protein
MIEELNRLELLKVVAYYKQKCADLEASMLGFQSRMLSVSELNQKNNDKIGTLELEINRLTNFIENLKPKTNTKTVKNKNNK